MTDTSQPVPDPLEAWREAAGRGAPPSGDGEAPAAAHRPTRLFAAAAVTVAIALFLAAGAVRTPRPPAAAPVAPSAAVLPSPTTGAPASAPTEPPVPLGPDNSVAAADSAAAVLAVRTSAPPDTYVDTAIADGATGTGEVTVVTVRALVLHRSGRGWGAGRAARFAVPIGRRDGQAVALAAPWRLAAAPAATAAPRWTAVDDAGLSRAAARAADGQGYAVDEPIRLRRASDVPGVLAANFRGVAPGDTAARRHELWLDDGATTVLGARQEAAALPVPTP